MFPTSPILNSPDKKEAAAFFDMAIKNPTPFGEKFADMNAKIHWIAFFKLDSTTWKFQRIEFDIDKVLKI